MPKPRFAGHGMKPLSGKSSSSGAPDKVIFRKGYGWRKLSPAGSFLFMKKLFIIPIFIALSVTAGWLLRKEQLLEKNTATQLDIIENTGQKGASPTTEEKSVDTNNPFYDPSLGRIMTKKEVMIDAYNQGVTDVNELEKIAATYDLLVFGETDIDTSESSQAVNVNEQPVIKLPTSKPIDTSFTDKLEQERKEKCQEDINEYNTCLNEYNSELAEYNACLVKYGNKTSPLTGELVNPDYYCVKPYSSCSKPSCAGIF